MSRFHSPALMSASSSSCSTGRTCKSALVFAVPDTAAMLHDEARKLLACQDIVDDEETFKRLDEAQRRQLKTAGERSARDLKEAVWRTYRYVLLLDRDNTLKVTELTQPNSSMANSLAELIVNRLRADDEIADGVGAHRLVRYWPPALAAWSTKAARDAFYSSPALPRLLDPTVLKRTIADGVARGLFGYATQDAQDRFEPLYFNTALGESEVEFSDETFLLTADDVRTRTEPPRLARVELNQANVQLTPGGATTFAVTCYDQHGQSYPCPDVEWSAQGGAIDQAGRFIAESAGTYMVRAVVEGIETSAVVNVVTGPAPPPPPPPRPRGVRWQGNVPPQKWMNFYTKVLSRFASTPGLRLTVSFEVPPECGVTRTQVEETCTALRELGLDENLEL
jgi:hypothetical protein